MKRRPPPLDRPYRKHRPLSDEEHRLWRETMGEKLPEVLSAPERQTDEDWLPPSELLGIHVAPKIKHRKKEPVPERVDAPTRKKILRGRLELEATLDLHGHTRVTAHAALVRFIEMARNRGIGLAIIITGKGRAGKPGILRDELPRWLNEPPLRAAIIAYDAAGDAHGGEGAYYVRIRKRRTVHQ